MSENEGKLSPYMEAFITLDMPCPKCGSNNHRHIGLDHCAVCGTYPYQDIEEDMPMSDEIKKPEYTPDKIPYACAICGVVEYKTPKAKRVLCKKHEDQRINANRRKGIILTRARKEYVCVICKEKIKIATKHWCNQSRHGYSERWHSHCNVKRMKQIKAKFSPQSILSHT